MSADERPADNGGSDVSVLYTGYGEPGVASTVGFIRDGETVVVTDPGMVADRRLILDPLPELASRPRR